MKKIFLLTLAAILISKMAFCQPDFVCPTNYSLVTKEDYTPYEKDIIAAAKWLEAFPMNQENNHNYREVAEFVIKWINGSPTVNVELNETIFDFDKKNKGMMLLYMAACARYVLENNYTKDMRAKHKAALQTVIKVYRAGNGIKKDKKMDKLVKANEEGKLDEWLQENLKIQGH